MYVFMYGYVCMHVIQSTENSFKVKLGIAVGTQEGALEGAKVGALDGEQVGAAEGTVLGTKLGP
jgi:hypothetical protein